MTAIDRAGGSVLAALVLVGVGVVVVGGVAVLDSGPPSGEDVLDRVHDRYESADSVTGVAEVRATNGTVTRTATVEFAAAEPDSARVTVEYDGATYAAGTNGSVAWVSAPALGIARTYTEADLRAIHENHSEGDWPGRKAHEWSDGLPENFSEANVTATRVGTATVDGHRTHVVELTHDDPRVEATATVYVDADDYRVRKVRVVDGDRKVTVRFRNVEFGVSVHDSTFAAPGDREVTDLDVTRYDSRSAAENGSSIDLPALDREFHGAVATDYRGDPVVVQRYGGPTNVTVVSTTAESLPLVPEDGESVRVDGVEATLVEAGDRKLVTWRADGVTHLVVADVSDRELVAIARGLR